MGRSWGNMPRKVPGLGEEKVSVPMTSPGKTRPLAGGNREHLGKWWLTQGYPGHVELLSCARPEEDPGWPKVSLGPGAIPFQEVKTVFCSYF